MSRLRSRHAGRAFTLIEIMVVISIILVLASLVLGVGSALLRCVRSVSDRAKM